METKFLSTESDMSQHHHNGYCILAEKSMLLSRNGLSADWITFAKSVSRTHFHLNWENATEEEISVFEAEGNEINARSQLTSSES